MDDVLGYAGKRAVVTGAASGMAEQAAVILTELGAEVIALDVKPVSADVTTAIHVDLGDRASIDVALAEIDGPVDAVFSCAGLPGPPFTDVQVMTVNFIGARHLIEGLVGRMPSGAAVACIASAAGIGWQQQIETYAPLLATETFDDAVAWIEGHPEMMPWGGYVCSKVVLNQWVASRGFDYMTERGIRLNCINPGPTDSAMMAQFHAFAGREAVDAAIGPIGRYSEPVEQAWPIVCLNSPRLSYVSGESFFTDGGYLGAMTMGRQEGFLLLEGGTLEGA
jgi:NAD(P)-dependent dehydrogenase (short-subunit alcohol dehydrogenase family)